MFALGATLELALRRRRGVRIARALTRRSEPTDRKETMTRRWDDVREIRQLVRASEIHDGLALTGLCWASVLGVVAATWEPRSWI